MSHSLVAENYFIMQILAKNLYPRRSGVLELPLQESHYGNFQIIFNALQ